MIAARLAKAATVTSLAFGAVLLVPTTASATPSHSTNSVTRAVTAAASQR
jgi:uncharacterized protein YbaA (DUF1428 family)